MGKIRVVEVSGFDYSACGGTHPKSTGEVGLIKILKWDKIRNNSRFEFVCGQRALKDYTFRNRIIRQVAQRFTVGEKDVPDSVERLFVELKSQKKSMKKVRTKILQFEAEHIIQNAEDKVIVNIFSYKTPDEIKLLALNIIKRGEFVVLYGTQFKNRGYLVFARSDDINLDLRSLVPLVSPLIKGKGGGGSSLVEISGEEVSCLKAALDKAYRGIRSSINA